MSLYNPSGLKAICLGVFLSLTAPNLLSQSVAADKESPRTNEGRELFYTFGVNQMTDSLAKQFKKLGVTSVETYVTWETCERDGEGKWNWAHWDSTVALLKENGLKWVPFVILGPAYSTPDWFREGDQHFPSSCLEHGIASKIESRWNPNLPVWIERFVKEFSLRYKDQNVIESVLLGIQGDFGEAIYSVTGGGWTFDIPGEYHNHAGYWCNDQYALANFRDYLKQRYQSIKELNKAWKSTFKDFGEVVFPNKDKDFQMYLDRDQKTFPDNPRKRLDFVEWYRAEMTDWSDYWMGLTRKYFPDEPIYLCTGGDAEPRHGSNFAEQTRVAAKHKAGIRITNEGSSYKVNFALTRWVASAGKLYDTYYGFEPAGEENERGIVARIYNATASGANQLHDYHNNVTSSEARMKVQRSHLDYLFKIKKPEVPVALWYPNVSLALKWGGFLQKATELRDYTDFDFLDETMLRNGALNQHKILIILDGKVMEPSDAKLIADWVEKGGHLKFVNIDSLISVEGEPEPQRILSTGAKANDNIDRLANLEELSLSIANSLNSFSLPQCDLKNDSIYTTQISHEEWLFLNTSAKKSVLEIRDKNKTQNVTLAPQTITRFPNAESRK